MNTAVHYHLAGMGTAAGPIISSAGGTILAIAPFTGIAAPFVALAGAVTELLGAVASALGIGQGCGQTCITASNYANQAEPLLRQNLNTYLALPAPRTISEQQSALSIFDQVWAGLQQVCGNPALNDAGKRCISDRQQGACTWKVSPGAGCSSSQPTCWTQDANGNWTLQGNGPAGSGSACWNWFLGYRDPIANDPSVVPDPVASTTTTTTAGASSLIPSSVASSLTASGIDPTLLLVGAGALVLVMVMSS